MEDKEALIEDLFDKLRTLNFYYKKALIGSIFPESNDISEELNQFLIDNDKL